MTRSDIVVEVAKRSGVTAAEADQVIRTFLEAIKELVANGEKITLSGFGTFERRTRKATVARNPKTGLPMPIAQQNVATFRAGSALKEAVKASPLPL